MSKKKRKSRKLSGKRSRNKRTSASTAIGDKTADAYAYSKRSWRWLVFGTIVVVLMLAGILSYKFLLLPHASLKLLPNPDPSGVEGQVAEKILILRREVEKNPGSAAAWGKLGMNFDVHDLKQEAVSCYKQAVALDPSEFRWQYYCAVVLRDLGDPEAIEWIEGSLKLKSDYAPAHVLYGQMLFDAGKLEHARESFQIAIEIDQQSSHAYVGLARIALSRGDLQASQQYLLRALKINPRHSEARGLLAEIYRRLIKPEDAERELLLAQNLPGVTRMSDPVMLELAAEGVSSFWYRMRGMAYMDKDLYEQAVQEFQMALKVVPDAKAHNNLGLALQKLGRHDEAIEHYRAAVELRPTSTEALNNLGTALYEAGKIREAIPYVEKALQLNPSLPGTYINLGTFYTSTGNTQEAIEVFRQGMDHDPDNMRISIRLAWLLATAKQERFRNGKEAVQLAETVCENTGCRVPEILDVLAASYAETRQFRKAIETAQKAHQLAITAGKADLAGQIQSHLKLYQEKKPYHEK